MQLRNDDAHRELLPSSECDPRLPAEQQILMSGPQADITPERESLSPQSTYTTETGNQLLYRLKSSGYKNKLSWTSDSAHLPPHDATTLTSNQKFSMKQIAIFPPRVKRRVVLKNGTINVNKENVERRHQRYLQDTFTTMVDIQWRWNLLVFALGFILSWLGFAVVWWVICIAHGDLEHVGDDAWNPWSVSLPSFPALPQSLSSLFYFQCRRCHFVRLCIPVLDRDAAHNWLRNTIDYRRMSGSHFRNVSAICYWSCYTMFRRWICVRKTIPSTEKIADVTFLLYCNCLPSGWKIVFHVQDR